MRAHDRRWTHSDEILALLLEKLDEALALWTFANTEEKKRPRRPRRPFRYPRPVKPRRPDPVYSTPDDVRKFFTG